MPFCASLQITQPGRRIMLANVTTVTSGGGRALKATHPSGCPPPSVTVRKANIRLRLCNPPTTPTPAPPPSRLPLHYYRSWPGHWPGRKCHTEDTRLLQTSFKKQKRFFSQLPAPIASAPPLMCVRLGQAPLGFRKQLLRAGFVGECQRTGQIVVGTGGELLQEAVAFERHAYGYCMLANKYFLPWLI